MPEPGDLGIVFILAFSFKEVISFNQTSVTHILTGWWLINSWLWLWPMDACEQARNCAFLFSFKSCQAAPCTSVSLSFFSDCVRWFLLISLCIYTLDVFLSCLGNAVILPSISKPCSSFAVSLSALALFSMFIIVIYSVLILSACFFPIPWTMDDSWIYHHHHHGH